MPPPEPHIILTSGRSGSNHLVDVINGHRELTNYGEVLADYQVPYRWHRRYGYGGSTYAEYLDTMLTSRRHFELAKMYSIMRRISAGRAPRPKRWSRIRSVGLKEFSPRLHAHGLADHLRQRTDIKIVHLHRDDALGRAISVMNLHRNKTVWTVAEGGSYRSFIADPAELVFLVRTIEKEMAEQRRLVESLSRHRVYDIDYSDLFSSEQRRAEVVCEMLEFLGVEPAPIASAQQKILPDSMWETLDNAAEVAAALDESGLSHLVPERPDQAA